MNTTIKIFTRLKPYSSVTFLLLCMLALYSHSTALLAQTESKIELKSITPSHDVEVVIQAIASQMRAKSLPKDLKKDIDFAKGLAKRLQEKHFHYKDFVLTGVTLDQSVTSYAEPPYKSVSVMLRFHDQLGRVANAAVMAEYRLIGKKVQVERAYVLPISAYKPRLKVYYVPKNKMPKSLYQKQTSQEALLKLVQEKAISLNTKELKSHEGQDYIAFAFVMGRLVSDAKIVIRESKYQNNLKGNLSKNKTLNFDNWFVGITEGKFKYKKPQKRYHKVIYTPGRDFPIQNQKPTLIGSFVTP